MNHLHLHIGGHQPYLWNGWSESDQILYTSRLCQVPAYEGWITLKRGIVRVMWPIFRSTPPSRPNKVGLKCPSVRLSARPQKASFISMKFGMYVDVDEWCMTICSMTRSKVKVMSPWKSDIRSFSIIVSPVYFMTILPLDRPITHTFPF